VVPSPRKLLDWVLTIAVAIAFVLVFEAEVAKPYRIPSSSMEPTLHCARPAAWCEARFSDRVIVNRLAYRFESPKRGQIVVFDAPPAAAAQCGEGGTFVKRLIGLREPYAYGRAQDTTVDTWHVPKGEYFFMGDDRAHTCDSRIWGSVPRDRLIGPLLLTYWPPNRLSLH
jgi:signal peptidase I